MRHKGQYNRNRRLFIRQERANANTETGRSLDDLSGQELSDSNASWTSSQIKDAFGAWSDRTRERHDGPGTWSSPASIRAGPLVEFVRTSNRRGVRLA
jgi:hypothetical protein